MAILTQRISSSSLGSPVPGIIWGRWEGEEQDHWLIEFYERADVQKKEFTGILAEASGLMFAIPQPSIANRISGKTLDWDREEFIFNDPVLTY